MPLRQRIKLLNAVSYRQLRLGSLWLTYFKQSPRQFYVWYRRTKLWPYKARLTRQEKREHAFEQKMGGPIP